MRIDELIPVGFDLDYCGSCKDPIFDETDSVDTAGGRLCLTCGQAPARPRRRLIAAGKLRGKRTARRDTANRA